VKDLEIYLEAFANLHVKITNGFKAPNKAIMLISVIDLIRCGYIMNNEIYLEDAIAEAYNINWEFFYSTQKSPYPWTPFWHLSNEQFWHFKPINNLYEINNLVKPGQTASLNQMRSVIQFAYLDEQLFLLMNNQPSRDKLVEVLIKSIC
jgi:putative restriction endonuclease